ncbi:hypothetical protein FACS1894127_6180 [Clostridia bacterium]|nr:hypothetical protein FACS1894127_6180 [Clostridia bacterium]
MGELTRFKNQIFLHGIVFALFFEAGSLLVLGLNREFAYGLALGTCIAIVNFSILVFTGKTLLNARKPLVGLASYVLRLCVYGFAFYMALRVSLVSGTGAALGFFTIKLGIYNIYVIKPWIMKKRAKASQGVSSRGEMIDTTEVSPEKPGVDRSSKKKRSEFWHEVFGSTFDKDEEEND